MVVEPAEAIKPAGNPPPGPSRRRGVLLASLVVAALVAGVVWWFGRSTGSGDPGGKVMDQLVPAASALPGYGTAQLPWEPAPTLNGPYLTKMEPHQDSCDGRTGTLGWSQVVVQAGLAWSGSPAALFSQVGHRLETLGWRNVPVDQTSSTEAVWSKRLSNGSTAQATLDLMPTGPPQWEFVAVAPPVGRTASGC